MNDIAIRVENLSKRYRIGVERHDTLRDALTATFRRKDVATLARSHGNTSSEEFWALRDVSFEVKRGEVVGVIGRNGAGKSTLLKILSRITEPTGGLAEIHGRVGSLLEVGTGFHPELTGRENIYLNGAILGMKRTEIDSRFDEIVAFSEIEKFLDTPVKRYSSGMYVRLAFAVAAHLEPEILLVDEVLAVGDVAFQRKCLGKMGDVAKEGRTVLIVSHQLSLVRNLCCASILLESGRISGIGASSEVIAKYLPFESSDTTEWVGPKDGVGKKAIPYLGLERFALVDESGWPLPSILEPLKTAYVQIEGYVDDVDERLCVGFQLFDDQDTNIMLSYQTDQPYETWPRLLKGNISLRTKLDLSILHEGRYRLVFICGLHNVRMFYSGDQAEISIGFEIVGNASRSPYWVGRRDSAISPSLGWEIVNNV